MQLKALQVTVLNINLSEGRNIEEKRSSVKSLSQLT